MPAKPEQIRDLARVIAYQAAAIADDLCSGPLYAAAALLENNVKTLRAWVPDDRETGK
jgi:hypothetical protein